jgi:hypothetical protein
MKTAGQMVDGDVSRNIILPQCNKPLTRNWLLQFKSDMWFR